MNKRVRDTRWLASVALMATIMVLLVNASLGMIRPPMIKATTVHTPVILDAILLGPLAGNILGGVFSICPMISNTTTPTLLLFAFSPFMGVTGVQEAAKAVWISVGYRILTGLIPGWLWILLKKCEVNTMITLSITDFASAIASTVLVMGSIYSPLAKEYVAAKSMAINAAWDPVLGTAATSGIPKAIAAAVLVVLIGRALLKVVKQLVIKY